MRKIYLSVLGLITASGLYSQAFWTPTTYKGAFPVTDGTTGITSNDWTAGWCNWDPQNVNYPSTTVTVSADITTNTTWTTGTVVFLQNKVYVTNGAVLTIQPGVIIRGDQATGGTLIITRGAKINAQGTQSNPIVFTSNQAAGSRNLGDWGGVVILGNARNNQPGGVAVIEGGLDPVKAQFGGTNDLDNSGIFSYVRIEFAGIPFQVDKEIKNLTLELISINEKRNEYQYRFDQNNETFTPLLNLTQLVTENLNCVDKYLRKLFSKSLPGIKIPLGEYEKQRIHEKKGKCFRKLEIFSLEISRHFDNKNLGFSNNLTIIMNLYHLAKGNYPKMITQIKNLNTTINHLFDYYSKINNFYSNGTTVLSYYSASIHNKKSLLNNYKNSHLMHLKELSENLDDLSTEIQKTISINEDTAETYAKYCVNTISSLKYDIRRE